MQQSKQKVQNYQEDEIDLRVLAYSLIERKFLILGLTAFITALAALYTTTFTPTYQATSSFSTASSSSITNLNTLIYKKETKNSIFSSFLSMLESQDLQKKVFTENNFLTKFNKDNKPIDNVDEFIENAIRSITIITPKLIKLDMTSSLYEKSYSISIAGDNAKAISNYLDLLIKRADSKNIEEIIKLNQQMVFNRLDEISIEIELILKKFKKERINQISRIEEEDAEKIRNIKDQINRVKYQATQNRLSQIAVLTDSARVAKSLGIIENNFKLFDGNSTSEDLTMVIGENLDLPEWYFYGEKALLQTINLLESRVSDDPFIPELVTLSNQLNEVQNNNLLKTLNERQDDSPFIPELVALNLEKSRLELTKVNSGEIKSIKVIGFPKILITSRNKNLFVLLAFFGSFVMSIFLALIMNALKPDKKAPA